jgi:GGDEF domain-containing protein
MPTNKNVFSTLCLYFVLSLFSPFSVANDKNDNKVVVSTLESTDDVSFIVPSFPTLDDLFFYADETLSRYPNRVLSAFSKYQAERSSDQLVPLFYFRLAEIYQQLEKTNALNVLLGFLAKKDLSREDQLTLVRHQAAYFSAVGDNYQAISLIKSQIDKLDSSNKKWLAQLSMDLAKLFALTGLNSEYQQWLTNAKTQALALDDVAFQLGFFNELVKFLTDHGAYQAAMEANEQAISVAKSAKLTMLLSQLEVEKAELLVKQNQLKDAAGILENLYRSGVRQRDMLTQFRALTRLTSIYLKLDQSAEAKRMLNAAKSMSNKIYLNSELTFFNLVQVEMWVHEKQYSKALEQVALIDPSQLEQYFAYWPVTKAIWENNKASLVEVNNPIEQSLGALKSQWQEAQSRTYQYFSKQIDSIKLDVAQQQAEYEARLTKQQQTHEQAQNKLLNQTRLFALIAFLLFVLIVVVWFKNHKKQPTEIIQSFTLFAKWFNDEKQRCRQLHVIKFDFDKFRMLNIHYGYHTAEQIVRDAVMDILSVTQYSTPCLQLSVDKFVLLVSNFTDEQAVTLTKRLKAQLGIFSTNYSRGRVSLTASFALTRVEKEDALVTALDRVEQEITRIKQMGGNRAHAVIKQ